jgi:histidyl-tRNA synthetase
LRADLYPTAAKVQKQFKYANNRKVPYVVLLGEKELEEGSFLVRNMADGKQKSYPIKNPALFAETL